MGRRNEVTGIIIRAAGSCARTFRVSNTIIQFLLRKFIENEWQGQLVTISVTLYFVYRFSKFLQSVEKQTKNSEKFITTDRHKI